MDFASAAALRQKQKMKVKFYRLLISMCSVLILTNVLVKTIIWSSAVKEYSADRYAITFSKGALYVEPRFTSELKQQKLFRRADYLLTPVFIFLFAVMAKKLAKLPWI